MKSVVALVDADYLEYAAGFAGQHTYYLLTDELGGISDGPFDNLDDCNAATAAWEGRELPSPLRWERVEVEPIENVLHSCKKMLQSIESRVAEKFKADVDMQLYLTGSGNFREQIATIRPYKGNRKPWHKPRLQREIREYMVKQWGATVVYGQEADDEVCILQTEGKNTVICGIDKDLLQCPGWHYDANKDKFAKISEAQGTVQFYKQLLTGDTTDNIGGCYRMGAKAASELIEKAKDRDLRGADLARGLCLDVLAAYEHSIQKYGEDTGYAHMGAESALLENGRLLWLRRHREEMWLPPIQ